MSLNQSIASLHIESDLLNRFGLDKFQPTELHTVALYGLQLKNNGCIVQLPILVPCTHYILGQRQRLRSLVRELSPECLDTAGHTPLMYAVFGKQAKV